MAKKKDQYYPILVEAKIDGTLYSFVVLEKANHMTPFVVHIEATRAVETYIKKYFEENSEVKDITSGEICAVIKSDGQKAEVLCGYKSKSKSFDLINFQG